MALSWRSIANRLGADVEPQPRPPAHVMRLEPYRPVSSRDSIEQRSDCTPFKLDWNEATAPPSPEVQAALVEAATHGEILQWYPDLRASRLRDALQDYTGVPAGSLIVTNGSDDALLLLCRTFLTGGADVVVPVPTYTHFFVYAGAQNARVVELAEPDPFRRNVQHLRSALGGQTRMVYLVSPNNPTGVVWEADVVAGLCEAYPHILFVVDEAYHEFSGQSVIQLTQTYSNLVVTRTFSKAFGLAAFRIGYLAAHPRLCEHLWRLHNPKSVNAFAQVAATAALGDLDHLRAFVSEVRAARAALCDSLVDMGFEVRETVANFINVRVPDPGAFCSALADRNVYVRDRSTMPRMAGFVRISVGTRVQMAEVTERIRAAARELGWF